ncbi:hypothetical protein AGMMS49546_32430 [Spirochaetia bacterium]|nr:hypothetical protein AGMMS49546_32430 [Spirochaetia bacterium]
MTILEVKKNGFDNQISKDQFDKLSNFKTASWAIWSSSFNIKGCDEDSNNGPKTVIFNHINELKNNIILLGLNRSGNAIKAAGLPKKIFSNFHCVPHRGDKLLKETISDGKLLNISGAYMTDLSEIIKGKAALVKISIKQAKKLFEKQLNILNSPVFNIICWGDDVFKHIQKIYPPSSIVEIQKQQKNNVIFETKTYSCKTDKFSFRIYRSLHYSYIVNGRGNNRKPEFIENLKYINEQIVL